MSNSFTVWSGNIQGGRKGDEHAWPLRADAYKRSLRSLKPDLAGFQEFSVSQNLDDILDALSGYNSRFGKEVGDGNYNPIFWNLERFQFIESGSEYLNRWGDRKAKGWDAQDERAFSWVYLADITTGKHLLYLNTHLDHIGEEARLGGIQRIISFVSTWTDSTHVILTADFNCSVFRRIRQTYYTTRPFEMLTVAGFMDAFRSVHGMWPPPPTYQAYKGDDYDVQVDKYGTYYIDAPQTRNIRVLDAKLIKSKPGDIQKSDHDAVLITVEYPSPDFSVYI